MEAMDLDKAEDLSLDAVTHRSFFEPILPLWNISADIKSAWRRVPQAEICERFNVIDDPSSPAEYEWAVYDLAAYFLRSLQRTARGKGISINWAALRLDLIPSDLDVTAVDDVVYTYLLTLAVRKDIPLHVYMPTLLPSSSPKIRPQSNSVVEKAFNIPEHGNKFASSPSLSVYAKICQYSKSYNALHYKAPYTSLVGPSGVGKSYVVKQLALQHNTYVVYISMAAKSSLGYPPRTPLANYIQSADEGISEEGHQKLQDKWKHLIVLCYIEVLACIQLGISPARFYEIQVTEKADKSYAEDLLRYVQGTDQRINDNYHSIMNSRMRALGKYSTVSEGHAAPVHQNTDAPTMVLCLDEARALLRHTEGPRDAISGVETSLFRAFRHAAREARRVPIDGKICDFFALLLDTHSKVANFSPAAIFDPSQKSLSAVNAPDLYTPIYSINSFDSFAANSRTLGLDGTEEGLAHMFRYGRPLWGAFLESGSSLYDLIELANAKTTISRGSAVKRPTSEYLLWMSHRITIYATEYALAEFLVAQGMRYLLYINQQRTILSTIQPSEPILSFVAAQRMQTPQLRLRSVRNFLSALHGGAINVGDVGEAVAALILQFSMDRIVFAENQSGLTTFTAVRVESFIRSLLGDAPHIELTNAIADGDSVTRDLWHGGVVYFNHVVKVASLSSRPVNDMEEAYRRGAALFLPNNFPGADLLVPVKLANCTFGCLLVQVKNRKDDTMAHCRQQAQSSINSALEHLTINCHSPPNACMGLFMSLRCRQKAEFGICGPRPRRSSRKADKAVANPLVLIALGLDEALYPSCFPELGPQRALFYDSLRHLRDAQPQTTFPNHPDPNYLTAMTNYMHGDGEV